MARRGFLSPRFLVLVGFLALVPMPSAREPQRVTVTAYTWSGQRSSSGKWPGVGMLALSRDLERELHLRFGQTVRLQGLGIYRFECRMPRRWHRRADIFVASRQAALRFGKRTSQLSILPEVIPPR